MAGDTPRCSGVHMLSLRLLSATFLLLYLPQSRPFCGACSSCFAFKSSGLDSVNVPSAQLDSVGLWDDPAPHKERSLSSRLYTPSNTTDFSCRFLLSSSLSGPKSRFISTYFLFSRQLSHFLFYLFNTLQSSKKGMWAEIEGTKCDKKKKN